ncbi:MAG: hypothetical protein BRC33_02495 [Cyanobacteria bacterium SW_9_44_58]|nr:MAG: hypothetical protein BRC33_02495 [Cyanobacteria bacterium SW_9_44_58]
MTTDTMLFSNAPEISADDYCVFGVATCFIREEGETKEVKVIEPLPSSSLESVLGGAPTSYQMVAAKPVKEVFDGQNLIKPDDFPQDADFGTDFTERIIAAVRTYKSHEHLQSSFPLGTLRDDLNHSTKRKRVLNAERIVRTEEKAKQHSHPHKAI